MTTSATLNISAILAANRTLILSVLPIAICAMGPRSCKRLTPVKIAAEIAELLRGLSESQHFIFEPRYSGRIVAGAHVALCVHGLDPVAAKCVLHANQLANFRRRVRNLRKSHVASAGEHALHVAVACGGADHVGSNDQPWSASYAVIYGIAQIDGGPFRIQRSHVAKSCEAVAHVLLSVVQPNQRFSR